MPTVSLAPLAMVCTYTPAFALSNGSPVGGTYSGMGVNSNMFSPSTVGIGTYYITYTGGACTTVDSVPITVDLCIGVNQLANDNEITIMPNPFTEQITISFSSEQTNTTIKVMDLEGRIINDKLLIINGKTVTLDMSSYAKGVYFVQIIDANKNVVNRKVVKE
jgi:hypothetical protein